jgi:formylglycine-generating enzyme required for sulfatase activity
MVVVLPPRSVALQGVFMRKALFFLLLSFLCFVHSAFTLDIELSSGWNLITIPINEPQGVRGFLSAHLFRDGAPVTDVDETIRRIWVYDDGWASYANGSGFDNFKPNHGYWFYLAQPATISINDNDFSLLPLQINKTGWVLVGIGNRVPLSFANEVLAQKYIDDNHVPQNVRRIWGYKGIWSSFTTFPEMDDVTKTMNPGQGYWFYVQSHEEYDISSANPLILSPAGSADSTPALVIGGATELFPPSAVNIQASLGRTVSPALYATGKIVTPEDQTQTLYCDGEATRGRQIGLAMAYTMSGKRLNKNIDSSILCPDSIDNTQALSYEIKFSKEEKDYLSENPALLQNMVISVQLNSGAVQKTFLPESVSTRVTQGVTDLSNEVKVDNTSTLGTALLSLELSQKMGLSPDRLKLGEENAGLNAPNRQILELSSGSTPQVDVSSFNATILRIIDEDDGCPFAVLRDKIAVANNPETPLSVLTDGSLRSRADEIADLLSGKTVPDYALADRTEAEIKAEIAKARQLSSRSHDLIAASNRASKSGLLSAQESEKLSILTENIIKDGHETGLNLASILSRALEISRSSGGDNALFLHTRSNLSKMLESLPSVSGQLRTTDLMNIVATTLELPEAIIATMAENTDAAREFAAILGWSSVLLDKSREDSRTELASFSRLNSRLENSAKILEVLVSGAPDSDSAADIMAGAVSAAVQRSDSARRIINAISELGRRFTESGHNISIDFQQIAQKSIGLAEEPAKVAQALAENAASASEASLILAEFASAVTIPEMQSVINTERLKNEFSLNEKIIADARNTADKIEYSGNSVSIILDSGNSFDPLDETLMFRWFYLPSGNQQKEIITEAVSSYSTANALVSILVEDLGDKKVVNRRYMLEVANSSETRSAEDHVSIQFRLADEQPPVAVGPTFVTAHKNVEFVLSAIQSYDPDGRLSSEDLFYEWDLGEAVYEALNGTGPNSSEFLLRISEPGFYDGILRVKKSASSTLEATHSFRIKIEDDLPPVADAGYDFSLTLEEAKSGVRLANFSYSPDSGKKAEDENSGLTFEWLPRSFFSEVQGLDYRSAKPLFLVSSPGEYIVNLQVTETESGQSATDSINITVKRGLLPIADAGSDQVLRLPSAGNFTINLDGSRSFSFAGDEAYKWAGPLGINSANESEISPQISLSSSLFTQRTVLRYTLTVRDSNGESQVQKNITLIPAIRPPLIIASTYPVQAEYSPGDILQIDASASFSPNANGSLQLFEWRLLSDFGEQNITPNSRAVSLIMPECMERTEMKLRLVVTDNTAVSSSHDFSFILRPLQRPPVAVVNPEFFILEDNAPGHNKNRIKLSAAGSYSIHRNSLSYSWDFSRRSFELVGGDLNSSVIELQAVTGVEEAMEAIRLHVTDQVNGLSAVAQTMARILPAPVSSPLVVEAYFDLRFKTDEWRFVPVIDKENDVYIFEQNETLRIFGSVYDPNSTSSQLTVTAALFYADENRNAQTYIAGLTPVINSTNGVYDFKIERLLDFADADCLLVIGATHEQRHTEKSFFLKINPDRSQITEPPATRLFAEKILSADGSFSYSSTSTGLAVNFSDAAVQVYMNGKSSTPVLSGSQLLYEWSYDWQIPAGSTQNFPAVFMNGLRSPEMNFMLPLSELPSTIVITLNVTESITGLSSRKSFFITASRRSDLPPVAVAGKYAPVLVPRKSSGQVGDDPWIFLDGGSSYSPTGRRLSFHWEALGTQQISNPASKTVSMQLTEGIHHFVLRVTDSNGLFSTDKTSVEVIKEPADFSELYGIEGIAEISAAELFVGEELSLSAYAYAYSLVSGSPANQNLVRISLEIDEPEQGSQEQELFLSGEPHSYKKTFSEPGLYNFKVMAWYDLENDNENSELDRSRVFLRNLPVRVRPVINPIGLISDGLSEIYSIEADDTRTGTVNMVLQPSGDVQEVEWLLQYGYWLYSQTTASVVDSAVLTANSFEPLSINLAAGNGLEPGSYSLELELIAYAFDGNREVARFTDSSAHSFNILPPPAPEAPRISASITNDNVLLDWNPVPGAISYRVYYSESSESITDYQLTTDSAPVLISGLESDRSFYFVVEAVNATGISPRSEMLRLYIQNTLSAVMEGAKLLFSVETGATIDMNALIAGGSGNFTLVNDYAVREESLINHRDESPYASSPGAWGRWSEDWPASVRLTYAINDSGTLHVGASGDEREVLSVLTENGMNSTVNFDGTKLQNEEAISYLLNQDIRMTYIGYLAMKYYGEIYRLGHVSGGPENSLQFCRQTMTMTSNYAQDIHVLFSAIIHQQRDYSWHDSWYVPIENAQHQKWSPAPVLDRSMNLQRSFRVSYIEPEHSFVGALCGNDNGNNSFVALDGENFCNKWDWGHHRNRALDIYPQDVEIKTYTTWSSTAPRIWIAVLGGGVEVTEVVQSVNGEFNTTGSFSPNPAPFLLRIRPGENSFSYDSATTLPAPLDLVSVPGDGMVSLSWSPVTEAAFYRVNYRSSQGEGSLLVTENNVAPDFFINGIDYYFTVQAIASDGKEGELTNELMATPVSATAGILPENPSSQLVAYLVNNKNSLSSTESEFRNLMTTSGTELITIDPLDIKNHPDLLENFVTMACFSQGGQSSVDNFDSLVVERILSAIDSGLSFVTNREACGARILGPVGYTTSGSFSGWYPALKDSGYVNAVKTAHPLLDGVPTCPGDPVSYSSNYWNGGDFSCMIWQVDNSKSYTGLWGMTGSYLIEPDEYLIDYFWTSWNPTAAYQQMPQWHRGRGEVIVIPSLRWSYDQQKRSGGYVGQAGRLILQNIARGFTRPPAPPAEITLVETDFSNGFSGWTHAGSPLPQIVNVHGRTNVYDNNGDSNYDSASYFEQGFMVEPGLEISADVYLQVDSWSGCWVMPSFGFTNGETVNGGEGFDIWMVSQFVMNGDACWVSPEEMRRHAYISGSYSNGGAYSFVADEYINSWQNLRAVIDDDYYVQLWLNDDIFLYRSTQPVLEKFITDPVYLWLGGRSIGGSYGKGYIHNAKVKTPGRISLPPVLNPPQTPQDLVLSPGLNQVTVSWSLVENADSYTVYYSTVSPVSTSAVSVSTTELFLSVSGLESDSTFYFAVQAVNEDGVSALSTELATSTLPVSPPQGTVSFTVDFSDGFTGWTHGGSPLPQLVDAHGRTNIYDNNGDGNYDSASIFEQGFMVEPGLEISADVYLQVDDLNGCWAGPEFGISTGLLLSQEQFERWPMSRFFMAGEACWATDAELRRHSYIFANYLETYAFNADAYVNSWQNLRAVVDNDFHVELWLNNEILVGRSSQPIAENYLSQPVYLWLGGRSSGYGGKAYLDNVRVGQRTDMVVNGDFSFGLDGWINNSKYMDGMGGGFYAQGVDASVGHLQLSGLDNFNYYLILNQSLNVDGQFDRYQISFDWAVPEKESNYGVAWVSFEFIDADDEKLGMMSSWLTANPAYTEDYWRGSLPTGAFYGERIFNEPFSEWRSVNFDTTDLPDVDLSQVKTIKVALVVQNDAGSGAIMKVDNVSVTGFSSSANIAAPLAPTDLQAITDSSRAALSWTSSTNAVDYRVSHREPGSDSNAWIYSLWSAGTSALITGLSSETAYEFMVQARNPEGALSLFSAPVATDTLPVTTSTAVEADFSAGFTGWTHAGSPLPQLVDVHGRTNVYDNNGDANYDSASYFEQGFMVEPGLEISADVYLQIDSWSGCWVTPSFGFTNGELVHGGQQFDTWVVTQFFMAGDACWASPEETRRHAYISGSYSTGGTYSFVADDYINSWQNLRAVIDDDYYVQLWLNDDIFLYRSTQPVLEKFITDPVYLWLGGRSYGGSYGKGYIHNAKVKTPGNDQIPLVAPDSPLDLEVTAGDNVATVSWTAVSGATGYRVYYSTAPGVSATDSYITVSGSSSTSGTVTGLVNGTTYYFRVSAINDNGESNLSNELSATPLSTPVALDLTVGDSQITISWPPVIGATSYRIYYATSPGVTEASTYVLVDGGNSTTGTVTGLVNGTTYYFRVSAINDNGESLLSEEVLTTSQQFFGSEIWSGIKLYLLVETGATINLSDILADPDYSAVYSGDYLVWGEPLTNYNRVNDGLATYDEYPSSVNLAYAVNQQGDIYAGVKGPDSDVLSIFNPYKNMYASHDFDDSKLQNTEFIEYWTDLDIRINMLGGLLQREIYKDFLNKSYVSDGPLDTLQFCKLPMNMVNNYSKPIHVLFSGIFHQQRDYSWSDSWGIPIDEARHEKWSPAAVLDQNMTLQRQFRISYTNVSNSFIWGHCSNDNSNNSSVKLGEVELCYRTNCCAVGKNDVDIYPEEVEINTYTTWSFTAPQFWMAVMGDDIEASDVSESRNSIVNPSDSFDQNPSPFIMTLMPGDNVLNMQTSTPLPHMDMIEITAGSVLRAAEGTTLTVYNDYKIGKYEVTQSLWEAIMGAGAWPGTAPSEDYGVGDDNPMYYVSWDDIIQENGFLDKLNEAIGCTAVTTRTAGADRYDPTDFPEGCYRLPTADESEFAHRAGSETYHYWGDGEALADIDPYAWYDDNSYNLGNGDPDYGTQPVGEKLPNDWDLYDMSGNVYEWTYTQLGSSRVIRGGSWYFNAGLLRSASRYGHPPTLRDFYLGFRLVFEVTQPIPATPTSLTADPQAGEVELSWDRTTYANSYNIYYATSAGVTTASSSVSIDGGDSTTAAITGLTNGTTYYFAISAVNNSGESDLSSEVTATPLPHMDMVAITAGTVNCTTEDCGNGETSLTIYNDFKIGKYEVTQGLWEAVMGAGAWPSTAPSSTYGVGDDNPMYYVSWDDIIQENGFLDKLNEAIGCTAVTTRTAGATRYDPTDFPEGCYRLPTADESEFAHRAGSETRYYWGDEEDEATIKQYAWYSYNAYSSNWTEPHADNNGTQPVGGKTANDWDLYDMSGNVREWTYTQSGSYRVYRGGSWFYLASSLRSAVRYDGAPPLRFNYLGFRLLFSPVMNNE